MPTKTKKSQRLLSAPDTGKYASFLDSLELIAIAAKSCSCHLDRYGYMQFRKTVKRPVRILNEEPKVSNLRDDHFDAEIRYILKLAAEGERTIEKSLSLECVFEAHFHTGSSPSDRVYAEQFAQSELRFILRPFARQFIADMTARMGIGPIFLPLRLPH
jgi:hypothetical protein